jgi:hypothetical protein
MKIFRKVLNQPNYHEAVEQELQEAQMALLQAETGLDWAYSQVEYNQNRIKRLKETLHALQPQMQPRATV